MTYISPLQRKSINGRLFIDLADRGLLAKSSLADSYHDLQNLTESIAKYANYDKNGYIGIIIPDHIDRVLKACASRLKKAQRAYRSQVNIPAIALPILLASIILIMSAGFPFIDEELKNNIKNNNRSGPVTIRSLLHVSQMERDNGDLFSSIYISETLKPDLQGHYVVLISLVAVVVVLSIIMSLLRILAKCFRKKSRKAKDECQTFKDVKRYKEIFHMLYAIQKKLADKYKDFKTPKATTLLVNEVFADETVRAKLKNFENSETMSKEEVL